MLITFRSNSSADVLMLEKNALEVLKACGRSYDKMPSSGVFTPEQLPQAITLLKEAMDGDSHKAQQSYAHDDAIEQERDQNNEPTPHPVHQAVSLTQRIYPLYEMMCEAQKEGDSVVWQSGSAW